MILLENDLPGPLPSKKNLLVPDYHTGFFWTLICVSLRQISEQFETINYTRSNEVKTQGEMYTAHN